MPVIRGQQFAQFFEPHGVDGGFSGGPIFWGNRICGMVAYGKAATPDDKGYAYGASLWPLALMEQDYPGIGNKKVGALLDSGMIRSSDWAAIKDRISARTEDARRYAFIDG